MHSLKPSGDNIAQEFLRLVGQKGLAKSASSSEEKTFDGVHAVLTQDNAAADNLSTAEFGEGLDAVVPSEDSAEDDFANDLGAQSFAHDDLNDHALEDMIIDEAEDPMNSWADDLDMAMDTLGSATASEKKVLVGLSKIAGSLRTKGEAFAADVVEATALSIKGDLRKEAGRKAEVISELKKLASEFYNSEDTLAGDMVRVTINKIGGDPY